MKKILLLPLTLVLLLTGCEGRVQMQAREVDELEMMLAMGIDTDGGGLEVTFVGSTTEDKPGKVISASGETLTAAVAATHEKSDKHLFYGHLEHILISEEAAKSGILQFLDYIDRDMNMLPGVNLYIVKGATAKEVMKDAKVGVAELLSSLKQPGAQVTELTFYSAVEIAARLATGSAALAPALVPTDEGEASIATAGYAVFREDKLSGWLNPEQARGAILVNGESYLDTIAVKGQDGKPLALVVKLAGTKLEFSDGAVKLSSLLNAEINEARGKANVYSQEEIENLCKQAEEILGKRMDAALAAARGLDADFLRLYDRAHRDKPKELRGKHGEFNENLRTLKTESKPTVVIKRGNGMNSASDE